MKFEPASAILDHFWCHFKVFDVRESSCLVSLTGITRVRN